MSLISCGGDDSMQDAMQDDSQFECDVVINQLSLPYSSINIFGMGAMANDTDAIYIYQYSETDGGSIIRILKSNGSIKILASNMGGVNNLEIDNTYIYWLEYDIGSGPGQVKKTLKSGEGDIIVLAEEKPQNSDGSTSNYDVFFPNGLALDDSFLYWGEEVGGAAIRKINKVGGFVEDIGRGENFKVGAMAVDANYIYLINETSGSQMLRFAKSDGTKTVLTSGFSSVQAFSNLELSDNVLYWTEITDNGKAFSMPIGGGTVSVIKGSLTNPRNIFINGSKTYIAAGNGIFKINSDGSEEDLVCSNISVPFTINVDDKNVYIVDRPNMTNAVSKIVKI